MWAITILLFVALAIVFVRQQSVSKYALLACIAAGWGIAVLATTDPGVGFESMLGPTFGTRYFVAPIAALYLLVLMNAGRDLDGAVPFSYSF